MQMKPSIGPYPNYSASPLSQPHDAPGEFDGDATKTPCMISGQGEASVRREGAVVSADISIVSM